MTPAVMADTTTGWEEQSAGLDITPVYTRPCVPGISTESLPVTLACPGVPGQLPTSSSQNEA